MMNKMILHFEENKIDKIEDFALSFKEFNRLEHLELNLKWN